jgi:hypothetical protein
MSYIKLHERVRFFPSLTQKDLPLNFDKKYITTIIFDGLSSVEDDILYVPRDFSEWSGAVYSYGNYNNIVGLRDDEGSGNGLISGLDFAFWELGNQGAAFPTFLKKEYYLYYNTELNPDTNQHSGYLYYDIYNLIPSPMTATGTTSNSRYYVSVDIYESQIAPNNATAYGDIR